MKRRMAAENAADLASSLTGALAGGVCDDMPTVQIDEGTFKYVLIEAQDRISGETRLFVRGTAGKPYHKDVARPHLDKLFDRGLKVNVLGGGRIAHSAEDKTVHIYGFSYGFPADDQASVHEKCQKLVAQALGTGYSVTWSTEGY